MPEALPDSTAERGNVPALTSLRMIAAGLVFLHHARLTNGTFWIVLSAHGHVGVTLFFVLSGFLITVRYFRAWEEQRLPVRDYFKKRAARILPLYYVVLLLSLWRSGQPLAVTWARLPEWTMTQGLFWHSLYYAIIPTSWSLTVEECFYALAPLIFLAISVRGGLARWRTWGAILTIATLALFVVGVALVWISSATGLAQGQFEFFASHRHMVMYTICGRFFDFAVGMVCGFLYLRGDVARLWSRPRGRHWATAIFVVASAGVIGTLFLMEAAGSIWGSPYEGGWKYNFVVAVLAAVAIAALTSPDALSSRLLALPPFVYLGKISYALYLIEMAPLGIHDSFTLTTAPPWVQLLMFYAGMNVVSAILYEGIEKPARRWILSIGGKPAIARG